MVAGPDRSRDPSSALDEQRVIVEPGRRNPNGDPLLRHLELAVGAILRPPLDQDRPPMWQPNPWRAQVKAARERLRAQAETVARSQGR